MKSTTPGGSAAGFLAAGSGPVGVFPCLPDVGRDSAAWGDLVSVGLGPGADGIGVGGESGVGSSL